MERRQRAAEDMVGGASEAPRDLMTVGELARRTGLSIKSIREYEALGLIYSAGRSEANYRLFDESALWCVRMIGNLRSLGLTIKEIQELTTVYLGRPEEPIGPYVVDFVCRERRLVVEVDGGQHATDTRDAVRDRWLAEHRHRVLRFWNNDVLRNTDGVLETIARILDRERRPRPDY